MKKDLKYYLSLNYPIEITKIPEEEGGGYSACIPILGKNVFISDGNTIEEAVKNLENVKEDWFRIYLDRGTQIPLPPSNEDEYSGKLLLRIPKQLHRLLDGNAKINETSLNQYIQFLLSSASVSDTFMNLIDSYCSKFSSLLENYQNVHYNFENHVSKINDEFKQPKVVELSHYRKSA